MPELVDTTEKEETVRKLFFLFPARGKKIRVIGSGYIRSGTADEFHVIPIGDQL